MKKIFQMVAIVLASLTFVPSAQAEGFALYEWGARASGMANAFVALADDPSAIAHNPAGITQLDGTQVMVGGAIITPKMLIDTKDSNGETTQNRVNRHYYFIPHAFITHKLNDTVSLGFGMFTRYGLGNAYPGGWAGKYNLQDVKLTTLSFNPNVAFKLTDGLSLAVGVEMQTVRMKMHKNVGNGAVEQAAAYYYGITDADSGVTIKGHNRIGLGFNAALHYKFNDQWSAGFTYRSAVTHDITGDISFNDARVAGMLTGGVATLGGKFRCPDHFSLGVAFKPMPNLSIEVDGVYTVWSKFRNFNIKFDDLGLKGSGDTIKNWRDTYLIAVGAEYWVNDWWALRAGFSYETSPIRGNYADYMVETNGRTRYSIGTGFKFGDWTLDAAYTMFRSRNSSYDEAAYGYGYAKGVQPGQSHHGITHSGTISLSYKF